MQERLAGPFLSLPPPALILLTPPLLRSLFTSLLPPSSPLPSSLVQIPDDWKAPYYEKTPGEESQIFEFLQQNVLFSHLGRKDFEEMVGAFQKVRRPMSIIGFNVVCTGSRREERDTAASFWMCSAMVQ